MSTHYRRGKTGLVSHAASVALAPARSLSSHARRHYHERYKGRYRFAGLVFFFDLFLVGIAVVLLVLDLMVFLGGGRGLDGGLTLDLTTQPLRASDLAPVQAVLRVTDNRVHEDVALRWKLPEWVEVVSAQPAIPKNGTIVFGKIAPGEVRTSNLVLRIRAPKGTSVPFIFSIHQFDPFGLVSTLMGDETRTVADTALTAQLAVTSTHAAPTNASVPILVRNDSRTSAHTVVLRMTQHDGAADARLGSGDTQFVGDMSPGEQRVAFVDLGNVASSSVALAWELQDQAQVVDAGAQTFQMTTPSAFSTFLPMVVGDILTLKTKMDPPHPWRVLVEHPRDPAGPLDLLTLAPDSSSRVIALDPNLHATDTTWSLLPIDDGVEGGILTPRFVLPLGRDLPATVGLRYFSVSGDQLGVGPLPPRVGQQTTYWVVWTLGPTDEDFSPLLLTATLADGVRATGKFASSVDGTFHAQDSSVRWDIPAVQTAGRAEPVTFVFEISFTPSAAQVGSIPTLMTEPHAEAISSRTKETLRVDLPALTTDASIDAKAAGKGTIQP